MKRLLLLCAAGALIGAPVAAATPVEGAWRLPDNKGVIQIGHCGEALCGKLVGGEKLAKNPDRRDKKNENPALRDRPLRGVQLLSGFTGGPEQWTGGKVYNPSDGKTYKGEIELASADTLKVKGCVVKPICKSQVLTRVR